MVTLFCLVMGVLVRQGVDDSLLASTTIRLAKIGAVARTTNLVPKQQSTSFTNGQGAGRRETLGRGC